MAGITDRPFRQLCRQMGAGLAVSEMVSANPKLRYSRKTQLRLDHTDEAEPRSVQIVGAEPHMMAEAARWNVEQGAQIIDINMGCPAKKVCGTLAGAALLRDEALAGRILEAVVRAVAVPVTLKLRIGWDLNQRNGVQIARLAEHVGIQALAVHGRTRACGYVGPVDYAAIGAIKQAVTIPVIANGDIDSPKKARWVLDQTGADAVMIGRAAQGQPWLFRAIAHLLATGEPVPTPDPHQVGAWVADHLQSLYAFYGVATGVRMARKHLGWYSRRWPGGSELCARLNQTPHPDQQQRLVHAFFTQLAEVNLESRAA